ncbi:hypothetical protein WISP_76612 [Willisornis vidua]|uniref:Uncharacterized protein n=1 Tax=Willisornis vidua TaxID=1566151 RepID=A0ABQ9D6H7_9PASS|nr:hypothetical protein WISP_76612 [Willisornis vidua]
MTLFCEGNKKSFQRYIGDKRKTRQNVGHFQKESGGLFAWYMENIEALNDFFDSVFTEKCSSYSAEVSASKIGDWENKELHTAEDKIQAHLRNLKGYKSMRPDEMHPQVLTELSDKVVKPLSIISEKSWQTVVVNGSMSRWGPVLNGIPHGWVFGLALFAIIVGSMHSWIEGISKFADEIKLCGGFDMLKGRNAIQRELDNHERWAHVNLMKFNKAKGKVLHIDPGNHKHKYRLSNE